MKRDKIKKIKNYRHQTKFKLIITYLSIMKKSSRGFKYHKKKNIFGYQTTTHSVSHGAI